ncbi:hypothetical protein A9K65_032820 (plasmid) [Mesorhizobium sp. WSM1497]|nr:hypothetical protein A9K65_032820 [Mesorhizobium sp. WSM1497]
MGFASTGFGEDDNSVLTDKAIPFATITLSKAWQDLVEWRVLALVRLGDHRELRVNGTARIIGRFPHLMSVARHRRGCALRTKQERT